ncbi:molybdenum cofactor guanylyltransferase [Bacillus thermotolerans]|uniref:Probable molybdenum cofactor guanylyltransferase n=1 Tax=Bacillus thermotolerans TaxID=1221996 RepID=A0A0F5I1E6_BACTR|nr:molybdenum cofactor guanylyltransferase [Bacillus thermotolerans]KKB36829.1 Molybdopterin-guanine dinucleotide biosynthesis protein MobA [Bacillus thermotolerans]KKB39080.1 Molybdopterin-guanine dinucleotide biosynthesis protein MobA [Bacillus thermotolerans]
MAEERRAARVGIVLAGGESRRFGEPKAFAHYNGRPFYERAIQALAPVTDEVVLVSHPSLVDRFSQESSVPFIEDEAPYQGKGPLAGLYSVMKHIESIWYITMPCDTPLIHADMIRRLAAFADETYDAIIPEIDGRDQPLVALYHCKIASLLSEQLASENYRVIDLLNKAHVKRVTETDLHITKELFTNINTKDAYAQLLSDAPGRPLQP